MQEVNRRLHILLTELQVEHEYEKVEGIGHNPQQRDSAAGLGGFRFNAKHFQANVGQQTRPLPCLM